MDADEEPALVGHKSLSVGLHVQTCESVIAALDFAVAEGFDYISTPVYHVRYRSRDGTSATQPQKDADAFIPGQRWSTSVVPALSQQAHKAVQEGDWDTADSLWRQELAWFGYLGVPAALLPAPPRDPVHIPGFARLVALCCAVFRTHLWLPITLDGTAAHAGSWNTWNAVRTACSHSDSLSPVLVLDSVSETVPPGVVDRWMAEPVKATMWPTNCFTTNAAGYPVLPKSLQSVLQLSHRCGIQAVLAVGPDDFTTPGRCKLFLQYLRHCAAKAAPFTEREAYEQPYFDRLQTPLQPLGDNLEGGTYEVFERDTPKYDHYQQAIEAAVRRIVTARGPSRASEDIRIVVVGAGRGPLVLRALAAAVTVGNPSRVKVTAVEKNPNAIICLHELHATHAWGDRVTIHAADMRLWDRSRHGACDILVSELLGSFGDNELSPECLDGVLPVLKAWEPPKGEIGGLCIPQAYTSFLAPVTAFKAWAAARAYPDGKYLETPYVVRLHRACTLDTPQPAFTFTHTAQQDARATRELLAGLQCGDVKMAQPGNSPDNRRSISLTFTASVAAVVHGFAGYFDTTLTDMPESNSRVALSTCPWNHTADMSSWFPIFFPLKQPVPVEAGSSLVVHMWRCVSLTRQCVWYEWQLVTGQVQTVIHNAGGLAYSIKL